MVIWEKKKPGSVEERMTQDSEKKIFLEGEAVTLIFERQTPEKALTRPVLRIAR